jgi:1-phosphofructokinase
MIITVTLNPAIDQTAETDRLVLGGTNRLRNIVRDAGGKGINVTKTIAELGGHSVATGLVGGSSGAEIEARLEEMALQTDFIHIAESSRTNLKVLTCDHGITEFNEPGPSVKAAELEQLQNKLVGYARDYSKLCPSAETGVCFVFSGSLPQGCDPALYRDLITTVKMAGATAVLDADGIPFRLALAAHPDLIKPNKTELMHYYGLDDEPSLTEWVSLCRQLNDCDIGLVVLSLGAEGALFVSSKQALYAPGLSVPVQSTVGAGDSMVGALCHVFDLGGNLREAAALAMATSAGSVTTPGTQPPKRGVIDQLLKRVELQEL